MSITLNIVAGDIADLRLQLAKILGEHEPTINRVETPDLPLEEALIPVDEQPEKPKRRPRRTKAQIAADNAVAARDAEPAPPTKEDVSTAMGLLLDVSSTDGEEMMDVLRGLGALNNDKPPMPRLSALDESKYAEAIEQMRVLTDELGNAAVGPGTVLDQEIPS